VDEAPVSLQASRKREKIKTEKNAMKSTFEKYKGINIEIKAAHQSDGLWTASAEFVIPGSEKTDINPSGSARLSEGEARHAALQKAVENIDRNRIATGKP
jgi:hypothetical protein